MVPFLRFLLQSSRQPLCPPPERVYSRILQFCRSASCFIASVFIYAGRPQPRSSILRKTNPHLNACLTSPLTNYVYTLLRNSAYYTCVRVSEIALNFMWASAVRTRIACTTHMQDVLADFPNFSARTLCCRLRVVLSKSRGEGGKKPCYPGHRAHNLLFTHSITRRG